MKNPAGKLIMAGASLGLAVLLLVGTSMAWFSISKAPEISSFTVGLCTSRTLALSANGEDYSQIIDLSAAFSDLAPLRPVSTIDGIHWFIPTYDEAGCLNDPSQFICDSSLAHANISLLDENGDPLTGGERLEAEARGYYSYADFWVHTEEDAARVRLSVPSLLASMEEWEKTAGKYGSYVLANYEQQTTTTEDGTVQNLAIMDEAAETCVRIGFLVYDDEENGPHFYIYEPNCEGRSSTGKPQSSASADQDGDDESQTAVDNSYVLDYAFDPDTYVTGNYFLTRPIVYDNGSGRLATDAELNTMLENTILQKRSAWSSDAVIQPFYAEHGYLDSNMVGTMGRFLAPQEVLVAAPAQASADDDADNTDDDENNTGDGTGSTGDSGSSTSSGAIHTSGSAITTSGSAISTYATRMTSIQGMEESAAGDVVLCNLTKDNPVKIRLFIWIEGQDVDCWNDIAAGSFVVNLELAGESVTAEDDSDTSTPES